MDLLPRKECINLSPRLVFENKVPESILEIHVDDINVQTIKEIREAFPWAIVGETLRVHCMYFPEQRLIDAWWQSPSKNESFWSLWTITKGQRFFVFIEKFGNVLLTTSAEYIRVVADFRTKKMILRDVWSYMS